MTRTLQTVALLLALLSAAATVHASRLDRQIDDLPVVPAPPQAYVEWIAQRMRMNGLPMSIRSFRCPTQTNAALRHFEQWWSSADKGPSAASRRTRVGEWQVLALTSDHHHISVQIRSQGTGSEGTITTSPNPANSSRRGPHFLFPIPCACRTCSSTRTRALPLNTSR
jgi:hypothetical protein